jgi:hypothetical protein
MTYVFLSSVNTIIFS